MLNSLVDVGKITGKGWAVIEANSVYSSGLYGCDAIEVIQVIQQGVAMRDEENKVEGVIES
jgi:hypothetical protein